ncbi:cupredoxin domain-containing protein [Haloarcula salina]|uniref:Halocyanin n=1 Tax=Haloarcula salina TaxID=1429914 RepID=A0AA41KI65_9EURY|nr:halocyanin [Haloarcula salina]MBV0901373.1 halocyanin [Haloarcula salina]
MTTPDRRTVLRGLGLTIGAVAGCQSRLGSSGSDGLPDTADVTMTSMPTPAFEPGLVHVGVGGRVVWTHESGDHDTAAYHPDTYGPLRIPESAAPWDSPTLTHVGETFAHTFTEPGVYDYVDTQAVCVAHEQIGNVGRVVVGWPEADPSSQPGLAPPQSNLPSIARDRIDELNEQTYSLLESRGRTPSNE